MSYQTDVAFILQEVARLQSGPNGTMKIELNRIPFPQVLSAGITNSEGRTIPISKEGFDRLISIAERHRLRTKNDQRVSIDDFVRALKIQMGTLWETRDLTPSQKLSDRAVSRALRVAEAKCETRTYFVPVHLGFAKTPEVLEIGPVKLRPKEAFYKAIEVQVQNLEELEADLPESQRSLAAAKTYYEGFDWVAEAEIVDCAPALAKRQAERSIQHVMDFVHLLLGSKGSSRMRAGGPSFATDRRGGFTLDRDGNLSSSWSVHWPGNNLPETWWEDLVQGGVGPVIQAMGTAMEARYRRHKPSPLALRILDAMTWYGEGVRDTLPASKIVKFVTAIERLLVTRRDENLAETVARRGAALMDRPDERQFQSLRIRIKQVYDLRSSIVHGTYSPRSVPGLGEGLDEADTLTGRIIIEALMLFATGGFELAEVSDKRLVNIYEQVVDWLHKTSVKIDTPNKSIS